jgi:hypothetical protein
MYLHNLEIEIGGQLILEDLNLLTMVAANFDSARLAMKLREIVE